LELKHDTEEFTSTRKFKATTAKKKGKQASSSFFQHKTTPKFCPKVFFAQANQFVPNLLFKCTDLRNSLISPVFYFFHYKLGTSFFN